jgi:hypothetical protein
LDVTALTPSGSKPVQERFAVRYAVEWMGAPRERYFPTLAVAVNFARRITTDGTTAYPGVAAIVRMTRAHEYCAWEGDQNFEVIEISGERYAPDVGHGVLVNQVWGHV